MVSFFNLTAALGSILTFDTPSPLFGTVLILSASGVFYDIALRYGVHTLKLTAL
jgi:hypothetical protein